MADLDPLIRLYQKRVDDKQRVLADLYREVEILETLKSDMLAEIDSESKVIEGMESLDTHSYFGAYLQAMRKKIDVVDDGLKQIERRVNLAREDVRRGFAELKKVEITAESRDAEEARKQAKKESDLMDEIGLDAFRRGQEADSESEG
jgi:flagellar export protein FliJ